MSHQVHQCSVLTVSRCFTGQGFVKVAGIAPELGTVMIFYTEGNSCPRMGFKGAKVYQIVGFFQLPAQVILRVRQNLAFIGIEDDRGITCHSQFTPKLPIL